MIKPQPLTKPVAPPVPAEHHDMSAIWGQLLPLIAGGLSLPAARRLLPEPQPSLWWLKMQTRRDPELGRQYRAAQELRADALADEIAAIADEPIPEGLHGADAGAWVQFQRLRVDSKKWLASKFYPRQFGERVEVEVTQQISITEALEQARGRVLDGLVT